MLNLNSNHEASPHIEQRSRAMWATKYDQSAHTVIYKVVPFSKKFEHLTKDRRLVIFDVKRGVAECLSLETGEVCRANQFGKLCAHVFISAKRLEASARRAGASGSDLRAA